MIWSHVIVTYMYSFMKDQLTYPTFEPWLKYEVATIALETLTKDWEEYACRLYIEQS